MQNAYEQEEEFGEDGRRVRRRVSIGPIVVTGVVTIVGLVLGKPIYLPLLLKLPWLK